MHGGNQRPFQGPHIGCCFDWQAIPVNYPRPKSATPMQVSLGATYEPCATPNRTHGPLLAFGSCHPPQGRSSALTVGTPDANGAGSQEQAEAWLRGPAWEPATPARRADGGSRDRSPTCARLGPRRLHGTLEARVTLRITDQDNTLTPAARVPPRFRTHPPFPVPCAATADATVGGECTFDTTAEALVAGDRDRAPPRDLGTGALRIHDEGGAVFMTQGVFVP